VLRALHLGLSLGAGSAGALAEVALFLAIVGFAWPTRGEHQGWKAEDFQQVGYGRPSPSWVL